MDARAGGGDVGAVGVGGWGLANVSVEADKLNSALTLG
jgi:hypothetical protein